MTQIAITEEAASSLASEAARPGCSQEELASMLIEDGLRSEDDLELTPAQQERLRHSFEQAERGELIEGEIVLKKFQKILDDIAAR